MKEITIRLYKFDELSEEVRKEIAEKESFEVMNFVMDCHACEYKESMKHFENETGFSARDWSVGYGEHDFSVDSPDYAIMGSPDFSIYAEDCKGKLLFRWCCRFIEGNAKGKYHGKLIPHEVDSEHPVGLEHIKRYSKVLIEPIDGGWCPWTGVVTDCPLVEPIVDFYRNYHRGKFSENYSLEDLINDCYEKFFSEWQGEYDAYGDNLDGCVEEHIEINSENDWFFEDGRKFDGDIDELDDLAA